MSSCYVVGEKGGEQGVAIFRQTLQIATAEMSAQNFNPASKFFQKLGV